MGHEAEHDFSEKRQGVDKVTLYKWGIQDRKGEFRYIAKHLLRIDHETYQRITTKGRMQVIVGNWSWVACGALCVADRGPNGLWIIDGGTRHGAAMRRSDIKDLPCMVFQIENIEQEAQGFLSVNTGRNRISVVDRYRAMLVAGDPNAVYVQSLLDAVGRTCKRENNGIGCLTAMLALADNDRETLNKIWPVVHMLHGEHAVSASLFSGLAYIEANIADDYSLCAERSRRARLQSIGMEELLQETRKATQYYGTGGAKISGTAILQRYNKGLSSKIGLK